jgi:hypothetical protein
MREPKTLEYASSATESAVYPRLRKGLVIAGYVHLALSAAVFAPGLLFGVVWSGWLGFLLGGVAMFLCIAAMPLLLLAEIGMLIFHPRRFPVWIPLGQVLGVTVLILYALARWRM